MEPSSNRQKTLYILYAIEQIENAVAYAKEHECTIATLNFWAEQELQRKNIPFISLSKHIPRGETANHLYKKAQNISREWYRNPSADSFVFNGMHIGEALEPMLDMYLQQFLYYLHTFAKVGLHLQDVKQIVVPSFLNAPPGTAGPLASFEMNACIDALCVAAEASGIKVQVLGEKVMPPWDHVYPHEAKSPRLLGLYNAFLGLLPRKHLKIFASEYWGHIASVMETMDDAELVLMERGQILSIPWRQLFKHRIRFIHPADIVTKEDKQKAQDAEESFGSLWPGIKRQLEGSSAFVYENINWWPAVASAFEYIVTVYAKRVVIDALGLERILKQEKSTRVVSRASIGGRQHHFFVLARIARSLSIPSIELQHAGAVLDPSSVHSRLETSYLASYGKLIKELYVKNHGYSSDRIKEVGSPRFDQYLHTGPLSNRERQRQVKDIGLDPASPIVMLAMPPDVLSLSPYSFDSYEIAGLFDAVRLLQKELPNIQLLFKFRSLASARAQVAYIQRLFQKGSFAALDGDLFTRMRICDIVMSSNSSVIYESILVHKPLVLYPWKKEDTDHLAVYTQAAPVAFAVPDVKDILMRILTDHEYRKELLTQEESFLHDNYCFDGNASIRTASILRENLLPL